jgi:restriction endonuclease Mrr
MLPVLREYADGLERASRDAREGVIAKMALTKDDLAERLPNSPQTRVGNRVVMVRGFLSTYQGNRDAAYYAKGEAALRSVAASLVIVPNGKQ